MSTQFSTVPFKQVLTYPFKDERWIGKILIGLLLLLAAYIIPILPLLFIMGYFYQIMHRILVEDGELVLPEWNDWGKLLKDGWRLFCVNFLYGLPAAIFITVGTLVYVGGTLGLVIGSAESTIPEEWFPLIFIALGIMFVCYAIGFVLALASSIIMPPAMCNAVKYDTYKAAFRFKEWWAVLKGNFGGFLVALIFAYGLSAIVMIVGQILYMTVLFCCLMYLIIFVCAYYVALVFFALIPLVYKEGLQKIEEQAEYVFFN